MKSIIISTLLILTSSLTFSQSTEWTLTQINVDDKPVGHIYHAYAIGTKETPTAKVAATVGLRFICSTVPPTSNTLPLVAILWEGLDMNRTEVPIVVTIDDQQYPVRSWKRQGALLYREIEETPKWVSMLNKGKIVKFEWLGQDNTKYVTGFELKGFALDSFNKACKTDI